MIEFNLRAATGRGKERDFQNADNSIYLGPIGDVGVLI